MAAPSFETGAARPPQDEAAQGIPNPRLVAEPFAIIPSHDVKQPISFPRRMSAPGVCDFASLTPNRGVGGAPRNVRVQRHPLGVPSVRHKTRVNALMTRRSTVAVLGLGAALPSPWAPAVLQRPAVAFRIRAASSSQPGRSAWRAGSRASRGQRLQAAAAGRHASLRLQDVSGDAPR